jgi:hypothetical protein
MMSILCDETRRRHSYFCEETYEVELSWKWFVAHNGTHANYSADAWKPKELWRNAKNIAVFRQVTYWRPTYEKRVLRRKDKIPASDRI